MKVAFGPALPVGTAGEREYYDMLLTHFVPPDEACHALQQVSVPEIAPLRCTYAAAKEMSLGAALTIAAYEIVVKGGIPPEEVECSLARLMRTGTLGVQHKGKQKVFDLTEVLPKEPEVTSVGDHVSVRLVVRTGERGSLRPEVLLSAALGRDVPLSVTRTDLFIEDEGVWRRPQ
jgi:radical SAM-linked protein